MALHAVDDIDDAIDATKSFLFPFEKGIWLRMAFVVFFIGGGGFSANNLQSIPNPQEFGDGGGPGGSEFQLAAPLEAAASLPTNLAAQVSEPGVPSGAAEELVAGAGLLIFAIVGLIILLALAYGILSNFMEFVLTQALIDREIHVRQYLGQHVGNGVRLLLFRVVLSVLGLLFAGVLFAAIFFVVLGGEAANIDASTIFASMGLIIAAFVVYAVVQGIISGFTTVFVVPLMTAHDDGVLGGWSRLWGSMTGAPKQYLAYLFFSLILQIGVGIVGFILGIIVFIAVAIPFGGVAVALYFVFHSTAGIAAAGFVGAIGLVVFIVASALIQVPLTTFLRYYAMLVMGDIDDALDPMPEVRSAIRAD